MNKKIISAFFAVLLILLSSNISFAETGVVNTPALRIREKASKNSEIVTRAYEKDEVEIVGEEGDWYQVKVNGKTGYASKSLITKKKDTSKENTTNQNTVSNYKVEEEEPKQKQEEPTPAPEQPTTDTSKTVIKEDAVARIMPNFGSNEAILLTKDTEIEVLREFNNWNEISVNGKKVWILKSKVTVGTPAPAENTTKPEENKPETENKVAENKVTENKVAENKVSENKVSKNETTNKVENTTKNNNVNNTTTNTNTNTNTTSESRNSKGIVSVETANVREKADKNSKIIGHLDEDDEITIVAEEGDWYKITSKKVESGYVSKSLIKVPNVSSRSITETRQENVEVQAVNKGAEVANFAKQYLGTKYVVGGKTPETGFDCSGYTRYVFKNFGYSLGTVAADQNVLGTEIERSNLKEGDLILFLNEEKTKIGHTGVYIGNNEFIHAANPERGVVIDNLATNSYYSTRFVTARRIVE